MASLRAGFVVADEAIIREVINRIFQGMDSAHDIIGKALGGAFNASNERYEEYECYFSELRELYLYKFNLLKALVNGIDFIEARFKETVSIKVKSILGENEGKILLESGIPRINFVENLELESGFFAILDFPQIKGMKYKGKAIRTDKDLLQFFYATSRKDSWWVSRFLGRIQMNWLDGYPFQLRIKN